MIINGARFNNKDILGIRLNNSLIYPIETTPGITYEMVWLNNSSLPTWLNASSMLGGGFTSASNGSYIMSAMSGYNGKTAISYLFIDLNAFLNGLELTSKYTAEGSYGSPGSASIILQLQYKDSGNGKYYSYKNYVLAALTAPTSETSYESTVIMSKKDIDAAIAKYGKNSLQLRLQLYHAGGNSSASWPYYLFKVDYLKFEGL
jgi:hypothetical protein